MKIDLHVHSQYSKDSLLQLNLLKKLSQKKGITPIITDHNTIEGNLKYGCNVIAQEIRAEEGEIIGLFMMEGIQRGLPLQEVVEKLKQQDALIYAPHPFDGIRKETALQDAIKKIKVDVIEVFNGRTINDNHNKIAHKYAEENNIPKAVGSDSHTRFEFGKTYITMEEFYSKKEFIQNLRKALFVTKKAPLWIHALSKTTRKLKKAGLL